MESGDSDAQRRPDRKLRSPYNLTPNPYSTPEYHPHASVTVELVIRSAQCLSTLPHSILIILIDKHIDELGAAYQECRKR